MDEPAHVGCVLDGRLIGVTEARQSEGGKRKRSLLGVAAHSYSYEDGLGQASLLDQLEESFVSYNKSRGKKFEIRGRHGTRSAAGARGGTFRHDARR